MSAAPRFVRIYRNMHPLWRKQSQLAQGLGMRLAFESDGDPIPVTEDWRTDLCRLLQVNTDERRNVAKALIRLQEQRLISYQDGSVSVHWSELGPLPVLCQSLGSPLPVLGESFRSPSALLEPKPAVIIQKTLSRQTDKTDRQDIRERPPARPPAAPSPSVRVWAVWCEVTGKLIAAPDARLPGVVHSLVAQAQLERVSLEDVTRRVLKSWMSEKYVREQNYPFGLLAKQIGDHIAAPKHAAGSEPKLEMYREWVPSWEVEERALAAKERAARNRPCTDRNALPTQLGALSLVGKP